jgi:ectoine hydroxylase
LRLIRPVEQVFGEKLYMHQYKINTKAAFEGDVWQWHQDYGTWARDDGMPEPRAMNIAVFMDQAMPINCPLMLIPRSHKRGVLSAGHDKETTSYPLWTRQGDGDEAGSGGRHCRADGKRSTVKAATRCGASLCRRSAA